MKHTRNLSCILIAVLALLSACKKDDYKNDKGVHDPNVNMTTYAFLKSKPIFDSLVYLIDRAGLQEMVNSNITFFATTNYGVDAFLAARTRRLVSQTNNENLKFTMDSLPVQELRDSLMIYMFNGRIGREQMNQDGQLYDSELGPVPNVKFMMKLRRTRDYSSYLSYVDYVNFTKVIGGRDDQSANPDQIPQSERDLSYDCQTSGIISTTGVIHVLDGRHRFLFNNE